MTLSPLHRELSRLEMRRQSTRALAVALKEGSHLLPPGALRRKVERWAKRCELSAITAVFRIVTPPNGASFILRSNKRADHFRLSPMSEAQRVRTATRDLIELMDYVFQIAPGAIPLMLTLTSRNRVVGDFGDAIYAPSRQMLLNHQRALKTFFGYQRIQAALLGHVTSIECDFAVLDGQLTVHWHSHSLVPAAAGALSDERYIRQSEYVALWKRALGVSYKPIVDIRRIRGRDLSASPEASLRAGAREIIKYAFDTDIFVRTELGMRADPRAVLAFAIASYRRRLVSMDRIFCEAKRLRAQRQKNAGHSPRPDPASAGCSQTQPT